MYGAHLVELGHQPHAVVCCDGAKEGYYVRVVPQFPALVGGPIFCEQIVHVESKKTQRCLRTA